MTEAQGVVEPKKALRATVIATSRQVTPQAIAPPPPPKKRTAGGAARKQINMTPETIRMLEDLLRLAQSQSTQRDLRCSELMHGLVAALFEARDNIDYSGVPGRGRWGSSTATAVPAALKVAFQRAINRYCELRANA